MNCLVFCFVLACHFGLSTGEVILSLDNKDGSIYPVKEDSTLTVTCSATGLMAGDSLYISSTRFNKNINAEGKRKIVSKTDDSSGVVVSLTLTIEKISMQDLTDMDLIDFDKDSLLCKSKSSVVERDSKSTSFLPLIITDNNVPVIAVEPSVNASKYRTEMGSAVTFSCSANVTKLANQIWIKNITGEWLFKGAKEIPNAVTTSTYGNNENNTELQFSSVLSMDKITAQNGGEYKCKVQLVICTELFTKNTYSEAVDGSVNIVEISSKKIVQEAAKEDDRVEQGKSVTYTCPYNGYPKPTFTWKKDDKDIQDDDTRYVYSAKTAEAPKGEKLSIEKVEKKDRGVYMCTATFPSGKAVEYKFRLRTSEKLGALWPFLGILGEAILLVAIILGAEHFRKKQEGKGAIDADDMTSASEKDRLVGKDSVKYSGEQVKINSGEDA